MKHMMAPIDTKTFGDICALNRDNTQSGDYWLCIDEGTVTVAHQRDGEHAVSMTSIPRTEFNKLIRWYMRPQKLKARRKRGKGGCHG